MSSGSPGDFVLLSGFLVFCQKKLEKWNALCYTETDRKGGAMRYRKNSPHAVGCEERMRTMDFLKKIVGLLAGIFGATDESSLYVLMLVIKKLIGLAEEKTETTEE